MFFTVCFLTSALFIPSSESYLSFKHDICYKEENGLFINRAFESNSALEDPTNSNEPHQNSNTKDGSLSTTIFTFWTVCHLIFVKPYTYVSIISTDMAFLHPKLVYSELGPVELHSAVATFSVSNAVIVIVRSADELHNLIYLKSSLWNQESIFAITVQNCTDEINTAMVNLWQIHRIYKYVLICGMQSTVMFIYQPFQQTEGHRIVQITDLSEIIHNIVHAVDNLYGTNIRIAFFPRMPTAITEKGKYVGGVDYETLVILREKMNFTSIIFRPSDGNTFALAGKNISGSIREIVIGNADLAFNGHFLQDYKINEIKLTRHMYMDKICFVVSMPSLQSHYTVIIHIFTPSVWVLIVVMYLITIIIYYRAQKTIKKSKHNYTFQDLCFLLYELLIFGASNLRADIISMKFLLGSILITVLILNNTFQGSLVTVLNRPRRDPFIDTLEDIIESDVALQSQRAESLLSDPEIMQLLNVLRQRKIKGKNFIWLSRFPITKLSSYRNYFNYRRNETLHTVPECIMSNFLAYVVPKNSPFLNRINQHLLRFQEVGMIPIWFGVKMDHFLRTTYWPIENEQLMETQPKIFTMEDMAFIFTLLVTGLALSSCVFLVEFFVGYKNRTTRI